MSKTSTKMQAFSSLATKYAGFFIGTAVGQSLVGAHGVQWGDAAAIAGLTTAMLFAVEKISKKTTPAPTPDPEPVRKENAPRCPFL